MVSVPLATTAPTAVPDIDEDVAAASSSNPDLPWQVVVWDDPVNTMTYVVYVFRALFGHSKEKATRLMLQVHNEGRAVVSSGPLESAELDCYRLHDHGLWATLEQ